MVKRKINMAFIATVATVCFIPRVVSAEVIEGSTSGSTVDKIIVNNQGVKITQTDYNNILKTHPEGYLMSMSQEQYDYLRQFDYSNIKSDTKYIESTYNKNLGTTYERYLTKEEYNNIKEDEVNSTRASNSIETTYKELTINVSTTTSVHNVTLACNWKIAPACRSFDVIGVRFVNYNIAGGSQSGMQTYKVNGNYKYVSYSPTGSNIKVDTTGYGISMNLVNDKISELYLTTDVSGMPTSSTSYAVYGAYQHAKENVSLATSKGYTIGPAGLGGVFVYPYSTVTKYDGMSGVAVIGA